MTPRKTLYALSLLAITAIGIYYRQDIIKRDIWADEVITHKFTQQTNFYDMCREGCTGTVSSAPLEYMLMNLWQKVGHLNLDSHYLRLPAFVYSLLLLFVFWKTLALIFADEPMARWSAWCFFCVDIVLTYYAQEARPYSSWALLTGCQLYIYALILRSPHSLPTRQQILALALVNTLILQDSSGAVIHMGMTGALLIGILALGQKKWPIRWIVSSFALTILLPVLLSAQWLYFASNMTHYMSMPRWYGSVTKDLLFCVKVIYGTTGGGFAWSNKIKWLLLMFTMAWSFARLKSQGRKAFQEPAVLYSLLFIVTLASTGLVAVAGVYHRYLFCQRQIIYMAPFSCIAAALPCLYPNKKIQIASAVGAGAFFLLNWHYLHIGWHL